jgi:hypothetical protein
LGKRLGAWPKRRVSDSAEQLFPFLPMRRALTSK